MTDVKKALVYRRCDRTAVQIRTEDGGDLARCPVCGRQGDLNEVVRRAQEYFVRSETYSGFHDFQRRQIVSAKRLKNVSYRPGKIPTLIPPDFIFR